MAAQRKILIADNDDQVVDEIVRALGGREGFEIETCKTGSAARQALQKSHYDLLFADQGLPDLDGLTLIRETQEQFPRTVTVLAASINSHESATLPTSAHHFLAKPFAVSELISMIDSVFPTQAGTAHTDNPLVLKVVLGGDANVGKTTLINRYCTGEFDPNRQMTVGVDFHLYELEIESVAMRLSVWDLGGQERFEFIRRGFYRGARAVGLVFDASNRNSFYNLLRWWREAREFLPNAPVLLLANKTDLPRQIPAEEARQLAEAWKVPFYESSCATGVGVNEFFRGLAYHALKYAQSMPKKT